MMEINQLKPCPQRANCVSSMETGKYYIEPITWSHGLMRLQSRLQQWIQTQSNCRLESMHGAHLHLVIKSRVFGFVDDLELVLDDSKNTLHVRAAARSGYWDLGVNRRRVEGLRKFLS